MHALLNRIFWDGYMQSATLCFVWISLLCKENVWTILVWRAAANDRYNLWNDFKCFSTRALIVLLLFRRECFFLAISFVCHLSRQFNCSAMIRGEWSMESCAKFGMKKNKHPVFRWYAVENGVKQTNYMLTIRTNLGNQLQIRIKSICKHTQFPAHNEW